MAANGGGEARSGAPTFDVATYVIAGVLSLFGAARLQVVRTNAIRLGDSPTYLHLDFLGRAPRLWVIPLVYRLAPTDWGRMALQATAATALWAGAAIVLARCVRDRAVRIGVVVLTTALGLAVPVVYWDAVIMSESLSVALVAFTVACWIRAIHAGVNRGRAVLIASLPTSVWILTRQVNAPIGVAVALTLALCWRSHRSARAIVLVAVASAWAFAYWGSAAQIERYNSAQIIASRVLQNDERTTYFEARGMPDTAQLRAHRRSLYLSPYEALDSMPGVRKWIDGKWQHAYIGFLATHPTYTVVGPSRSVPRLITKDVGRTWPGQPSLPTFAEATTYTSQWSLAAFGVLAVGLLTIRYRLRVIAVGDAGPGFVLAFAALSSALIWHLSASDLERLMLPVAVATRIALTASVALSLDSLLQARRNRRHLARSSEPSTVRW